MSVRDGVSEVELDRLDLRYEALRIRSMHGERDLVASISQVGQLVPIVLVPCNDGEGLVVIDGFRRIRALRLLRRDVVDATRWELSELEALLLGRTLRHGRGETPFEQGWLLETLRGRFDLTLEELGRRFDKSESWVSRRLSLVRELPQDVQGMVRDGLIVPHAAAKCLVPLARANRDHCIRLARSIARARLSTRDVGELYAAWRDAPLRGRDAIVDDPLLFLRTRRALAEKAPDEGPREGLLKDVALIAAASRRASRRLREGAAVVLARAEREETCGALRVAVAEIQRLINRLERGGDDARSANEDEHPRAQEAGPVQPTDRPRTEDRQGVGEGRA